MIILTKEQIARAQRAFRYTNREMGKMTGIGANYYCQIKRGLKPVTPGVSNEILGIVANNDDATRDLLAALGARLGELFPEPAPAEDERTGGGGE